MFIAIDGIDGSGKGTQTKLLIEKLQSQGKIVKTFDYPRYDEASSLFVKKYLNGEYGENVSAKQASLFFALDRFDAKEQMVEDIKNADYVITNRYVSANMVHQTGKISDEKKQEEFLTWIEELEFEILGIPKPDKTILLDVSPETSQKLVMRKEARAYIKGDKKMDIHEQDKEHLQKARVAALKCAKKYNWTIIPVEKDGALRGLGEIHNDILSEVQK